MSKTVYRSLLFIQYGHGTGTGGYVQGRDYIMPAIRPIFDQIVAEACEGGDQGLMATIDDKVVAMSFESSKFESGVNKSISSLDKLKAALQFAHAGKAYC